MKNFTHLAPLRRLPALILFALILGAHANAGATLDLSDDDAFSNSSSEATLDISISAPLSNEENSFEGWKKFITEELKNHSEIKFFGLYIGGAQPYEQDATTVRFRPASTQKIFTTAAYIEKNGWEEKDQIPYILKMSKNEMADALARKLDPEETVKVPKKITAQGKKAVANYVSTLHLLRGGMEIAKYSNEVIANTMKDDGLDFESFTENPIQVKDEYIRNQLKINPYEVSCLSGSGFDGAHSILAGRDSKRSTLTVAALRYFLEGLRKKPYFENILRSLPYAGIDGTLRKNREAMANGSARATIAAKTGTLSGVKNLAGYVHTEDAQGKDDYIPFVILTRTTSINEAFEFDDAVVNKIASVLHATKIPLPPYPYYLSPKNIPDYEDEE